MVDLIIEHVDSVNIKVRCERGTAKELSDYFTFKVPGHTYMPAYRNRMWDGQIKLYNMFSQLIYAGLEDYVIKFATDRGYKYEKVDKKDHDFTEEKVEKFKKVKEKIIRKKDAFVGNVKSEGKAWKEEN